ncbi:MAG: GHKL domain-containing protein [Clostridium sp.]|nr:GHKL domain-containing protein [Clostridium sp.]MCM1398336.1 GHKL domain-containing protein [Clostridium sp.]MCM1458999.1 GHKL domain-containing protein [Bacteroides sp.]
MYNAVWLLYLVLVVFQGYCLQYFLGSFLERRWNGRWSNPALIVLYTLGIYGISELVFNNQNVPVDSDAVKKLILSLCLLSVIAACFYQSARPITIFLVTAFLAVVEISRYFAGILMDKAADGVTSVWNHCIDKGLLTSDRALLLTISGGMMTVQFLQYFLIGGLLFVSLRKIVRDFKEKDYAISRMELLFLLTPTVVALLTCVLLRTIIITVENRVPKMLYNSHPILVLVIPSILFLSLASILCSVKLFQNMIYTGRAKSERVVLQNQVSSMQEHLEEMERIYSEIRGMKHDMKNTIAIIGQLSTEENRELREYLADMNNAFERLKLRFKTGNTVADTLLNMKYHEALRELPDLKMEMDMLMFPQDLKIHGYDIGIILGNAIDNAVEACRRLKETDKEVDTFIRLISMQKGKCLVVKIENSFDGKLFKKKQAEFPMTVKTDKEHHGMGLRNIKNTVEKYHGTIDYKVENRTFILSVMMKNERN